MPSLHQEYNDNSVLYLGMTYVEYSQITVQNLSDNFIFILSGMMGGFSQLTGVLEHSFGLPVCHYITILHQSHMNSKLHYRVLQDISNVTF